MLITDFPIYINDTEIKARALTWDRSYSNVVNVNMTEDGVDDYEVIRAGKSEISAQFQCSDYWASIFAGFIQEPILAVRFYDVATKGYIELEMHMEALTTSLIEYSDAVQSTNGLYDVSFTLVEF